MRVLFRSKNGEDRLADCFVPFGSFPNEKPWIRVYPWNLMAETMHDNRCVEDIIVVVHAHELSHILGDTKESQAERIEGGVQDGLDRNRNTDLTQFLEGSQH